MVDIFGLIHPQIDFEEYMRRVDDNHANDDFIAGLGRPKTAADFYPLEKKSNHMDIAKLEELKKEMLDARLAYRAHSFPDSETTVEQNWLRQSLERKSVRVIRAYEEALREFNGKGAQS